MPHQGAVSHSFRIAVDMGTELLKKLNIFTEKNVPISILIMQSCEKHAHMIEYGKQTEISFSHDWIIEVTVFNFSLFSEDSELL